MTVTYLERLVPFRCGSQRVEDVMSTHMAAHWWLDATAIDLIKPSVKSYAPKTCCNNASITEKCVWAIYSSHLES